MAAQKPSPKQPWHSLPSRYNKGAGLQPDALVFGEWSPELVGLGGQYGADPTEFELAVLEQERLVWGLGHDLPGLLPLVEISDELRDGEGCCCCADGVEEKEQNAVPIAALVNRRGFDDVAHRQYTAISSFEDQGPTGLGHVPELNEEVSYMHEESFVWGGMRVMYPTLAAHTPRAIQVGPIGPRVGADTVVTVPTTPLHPSHKGKEHDMPYQSSGRPVRLLNSATGAVEDFVPRTPGQVSMYVCGPTVYSEPHIGHGRFTLVFDIIRRYLTWRGYQVRYVSNITDIDDKIIARAAATGETAQEIATRYTAIWWDAMDALGVLRPDVVPQATSYVEQMVAYIADLVGLGHAYQTADGVYLSAASVPDYGLLAHQDLTAMQAGGGERTLVGATTKRHAADFALWKLAKPGEPSWPSPWGPGRPGWHIECTVMALSALGEGFDLHGGGEDLRFPHHENERAQAVAGGHVFAHYWMHNGMIVVPGGEKMGKSKGNTSSLVELLDEYGGRAYRLLVLQSGYRAPLEVNADVLGEATEALRRLDNLSRRLADAANNADADSDALEAFSRAMDNDFDLPAATAVMFDTARKANTAADAGETTRAGQYGKAAFEMAATFGLVLETTTTLDDATLQLVTERDAARAARDWTAADRIHDELQAAGYTVEDTPAGTRISK